MPATAVPTDFKYDRRSIALHWITAALVLTLWALGQTIDEFAKGTPRMTVRSLHVCLGLLLATIFIARMAWRMSGGTRKPASDPGAAGVAARWVHFLLYLLLGSTLILGIVTEWMRGDLLFGLFQMSNFDKPIHDLSEQVMDVHGFCANALLILAGLHAAGALVHHYLLHDTVLLRMLATRSRSARLTDPGR